MLAATFTTSIVFFPVMLLSGVSNISLPPLLSPWCSALFASYVVAMTVVPLFCAKFIRFGAVSGHADGARRHQESRRRSLRTIFRRTSTVSIS